MTAWAALKKRFVVIGGPCVTPAKTHFAEYERSYGEAVPRGYRALMEHFGPGAFNDFARIAPPHHLQTYGEQMHGAPDGHLVFASTDNGDDFAWRAKASSTQLLVRHGRSDAFVPFADGLPQLVALAADRNLLFDEKPLQPFFMPMRKRRALSLRFASTPPTSLRARGTLLAQATHRKEGWSSWTLHLTDTDAFAHVQAMTSDAQTWWSVRVKCALDRKIKSVAAALGGEGSAGWQPKHFDEALSKAKATESGLDL